MGVTAVWGWTFLIVKDAIQRMPVMDFLAVRFTVAAIVMFALHPTCLRHMSRRGWWRGIILGILLGMAYITQTQGLLYTSPAVSGFITGMSVVFTPVVAWLLLRQKISPRTWLAVGLACLGLALLSLHGWAFGTGELLTLACAVFVAFHIIGLGQWSAEHETYGLAFIQIATVAVISLVAAAPGGITLPPDAEVWADDRHHRRTGYGGGFLRADLGPIAGIADSRRRGADHGAGLRRCIFRGPRRRTTDAADYPWRRLRSGRYAHHPAKNREP